MDMNDLLHRRQVSLMRAGVAACASSRRAHLDLAALCATRIHHIRALRGQAPLAFPA